MQDVRRTRLAGGTWPVPGSTKDSCTSSGTAKARTSVGRISLPSGLDRKLLPLSCSSINKRRYRDQRRNRLGTCGCSSHTSSRTQPIWSAELGTGYGGLRALSASRRYGCSGTGACTSRNVRPPNKSLQKSVKYFSNNFERSPPRNSGTVVIWPTALTYASQPNCFTNPYRPRCRNGAAPVSARV